jgi:tetratricopeptide (TPR) repeat protein
MRLVRPLFALIVTVAPGALADPATPDKVPEQAPASDPTAAETPRSRGENAHNQVEAAARGYFDRALAHYRAGRYHDAIRELDTAFALDPTGKDLAYNLAIVHERLGQLREAVQYLRRYVELESDAGEIASAREAITRIEGAREEEAKLATRPTLLVPLPSVPPPMRASCPEPGLWDGWVTATSGAAAAAVVVGLVFGVGSLLAAPSDDGTNSERSIEDLRGSAERARTYAEIADVAFGVGLLSGAAAGLLYFGRESRPDDSHALVVRVGAAF